ncbi:MAG: DNA-formamidopyrimidine glycosylase family protein [Anaerolineae bacterium]|jgi:formamidopyrimidine-DNA glycosylase|nr:DNA-formamidopyrimidine glycosylase family protein [Anaerolineae bacterium]
MFELPEFVILARQMNATLRGKVVARGNLGNTPHKFVWYNRSPEEFERLTTGKRIGEATSRGKWFFVPLEPGYVLLLGECGGKVLYHQPGATLPQKYHLLIAFEDGSHLSATTQMWGAMELYEQGEEQHRQYVRDMKIIPLEPEFTFDYFCGLIDALIAEKDRSAKALLTQDQSIPGLGNAIAQDILFQARLHPRHALSALDGDHKKALYDAILATVSEVIAKGGRHDEVDLYGNAGGYIRVMDSTAVGRPCPKCGGEVKKMQYLGGSCYWCPNCQH